MRTPPCAASGAQSCRAVVGLMLGTSHRVDGPQPAYPSSWKDWLFPVWSLYEWSCKEQCFLWTCFHFSNKCLQLEYGGHMRKSVFNYLRNCQTVGQSAPHFQSPQVGSENHNWVWFIGLIYYLPLLLHWCKDQVAQDSISHVSWILSMPTVPGT